MYLHTLLMLLSKKHNEHVTSKPAKMYVIEVYNIQKYIFRVHTVAIAWMIKLYSHIKYVEMLQHEICNYTNNFSKLDPKTMPQPSTHIEYSINLQPSQVDGIQHNFQLETIV